MKYAIGIDIGVTNIKSVCVTEEGQILSRDMTPTEAERPDWPENVRAHAQELEEAQGQRPRWLGIAAPGLASPDGTAIRWMQGRLDAVEGLNWTEFLKWPSFAPVVNDAQAALLGEVWQGAAAGAQNAVLLTLGTGVGGAILCDGRLLRGAIGRAGHLGHMCLDIDGHRDIVGTPGSLEEQIGNCTLPERTDGGFDSTHELVSAHLVGDAEASAVWLRSVHALACGLASIINVVDPEVVIIGGGIAAAGPALFEPLAKELDRFEWRPHGHRVRIVQAALGEYAGAIGAAWNGMNWGRVV